MLLKLVEINLVFHELRKCLNICAESAKSKEDSVINLKNSFEILGVSLKLYAQTCVSCNSYTIFTFHCKHSVTIVFEDTHFSKQILIINPYLVE